MENIPKITGEVIDVLAQKFGSTGAHLWEVIVRQQYVDAITSFFEIIGIVLVIKFLMIPWFKKLYLEEWDGVGWLPFSLVSTMFVIILYIGFEIIIGTLVNPEFGALNDIINMVNGY